METYCCVNGTNSASYPSAWYAFDAGNARFYVLEAAWNDIERRHGRRVQERLRHALDAVERGVPVAGERPADPSLAAQVRVLPLPDVLVERHARRRTPSCAERTASRACSRSNGVDIGFSGHAHNYTRNVKPDDGQPRDLRDRRGWRAPSAGHEMRGAGRVRGRLVVQPRRELVRRGRAAHLGRPGLPLPEGERRRRRASPSRRRTPRGGPSTCRHTTSGPAAASTPAAGGDRPRAAVDRRHAHGRVDPHVPIESGAGNALVAAIAVQAGTTTRVTGVTDSAGNSWTLGPVGLLAGSNTRVEIWHSTGAAPVAGVTVNLSAADLASANVSEWSGVAATGAWTRPPARATPRRPRRPRRRSRPRTPTTSWSARSTSRARSRRRSRRPASRRSTTSPPRR